VIGSPVTWLGAFLLKPALVVGIATLIALLLKQHSAAARHIAWATGIIAVIALPVLASVLPPVTVPILPVAVEQPLPVSGPVGFGEVLEAPDLDVPPGSGLSPSPARPGAWLNPALWGIWLLGIGLIGTRRLIGRVQLRGILRRASSAAGSNVSELVRTLPGGCGVELKFSTELASPAVTGILRPILLLPPACLDWSAAELRAALVHELAHVTRKDCLFNLLGDIASLFYWCNPLVWYAVARLRTESERACDDQVLDDGGQAESYAWFLLSIARAGQAAAPVPAGATSMARPSQLETRLLAVLNPREARKKLPRWGVAAFAITGLAFIGPTAAITFGAAQAASVEILGPEPDRRGDSLALPASERIPPAGDERGLAEAARQALAGPDSLLAQLLLKATGRAPEHEADLVRDRATWALLQVRDGRLVEPLLAALLENDWRVQSYAAWTLAYAGDRRATQRLVPLLQHPVWRLRAMAAFAIANLKDSEAALAMRPMLADPAWQVRMEAVDYFSAQEPASPDLLRPLLNDRHLAVRLAAERALTHP
jgi:beta-lactamase regulating signal transducer with metallopeptidase domain